MRSHPQMNNNKRQQIKDQVASQNHNKHVA